MKNNVKGRILAWVLTVMLVFTYMPQIAFATDTAVTPEPAAEEVVHDHEHEDDAQAAVEEEAAASSDNGLSQTEQERVDHALELIDIVLDGFGFTDEMTDKERLEEGLKNSKLTKEVAERTSTKLINVKLREKGAKNGK